MNRFALAVPSAPATLSAVTSPVVDARTSLISEMSDFTSGTNSTVPSGTRMTP